MNGPRPHGGDLDRARRRWGGDDWIDLSTGINRVPYPVPPLTPAAWRTLPTDADVARLVAAARTAYATEAAIVPVAGAQAAIQIVPHLAPPGRAAVLEPTYNEHGAALAEAGWAVTAEHTLDALAGHDVAVVVNPNNPDGRRHAPGALLDLRDRVGLLVVDESFCDLSPDMSLAAQAGSGGLVVLRSFGKFYGLAGLRLGFAIGDPDIAARIAARAGPWAVSGPAIAIGARALADTDWAIATRARLARDGDRLDRLAAAAGWRVVGGTDLFRLYDTSDAADAQARLARHAIWSRRFPFSDRWLRLGLPAPHEWDRVAAALA